MAEIEVSVVRYGVANLGSMINMLRRIGATARIVDEPAGVLGAERLILPGVGAFDAGMEALHSRGLADPIRRRVSEGVPLLGVCLGMQMLGHGSAEGLGPGLGLLNARCVRFNFPAGERLRVPHMGWGRLNPKRDSQLLNGMPRESRFYFVHSYHLVCEDETDVLASCVYGTEFTAMVQKGNIMGAQFHPEKSHKYGMALLKNFLQLDWRARGPDGVAVRS